MAARGSLNYPRLVGTRCRGQMTARHCSGRPETIGVCVHLYSPIPVPCAKFWSSRAIGRVTWFRSCDHPPKPADIKREQPTVILGFLSRQRASVVVDVLLSPQETTKGAFQARAGSTPRDRHSPTGDRGAGASRYRNSSDRTPLEGDAHHAKSRPASPRLGRYDGD